MVYEEHGLIGKLIHALKYFYAEDVKEIFDHIVTQFIQENRALFEHVDAVVPVPLHKRRHAERGFNQAALVGMIVARELGVPHDASVRRVRYTKQQVKLSKYERVQNVKDVFECKKDMLYEHVLLVDDVFTTGSTLQSCAKALVEGGVEKVSGFSMARG